MAHYRCRFEGCGKTTENWLGDGWSSISDWGPGVPDGLYCREHAAALEAALPEIMEEQAKQSTEEKVKPAKKDTRRNRRRPA